jgi:hypothetical protein
MATLSVNIERSGNDLIVSGVSGGDVVIVINGVTTNVSNPGGGPYSVTIPGAGNATSISVSSGNKATMIDLSDSVAAVDMSQRFLEDLMDLKIAKSSDSNFVVEGSYCYAKTHEIKVGNANRRDPVKATMSTSDFKLAIDNCPGKGHKLNFVV